MPVVLQPSERKDINDIPSLVIGFRALLLANMMGIQSEDSAVMFAHCCEETAGER
jgi:hypothetical protein